MQLRYPGISLMQVLCILIPTVRSLSNWLGGNFSYFNKVCGLQTKIKFLEEKKRSRQHWPLLICIQRLHNVYTNCFCTRQAVAEWTEKLPILTSQKQGSKCIYALGQIPWKNTQGAGKLVTEKSILL